MTCPRRDKWFRACKFEPRYDLGPMEPDPRIESLRASADALETMRRKTYRGDVCIQCGMTVHPEKPS